VITVISLISHGGALTQRWLGALRWLLGWGAAVAPVAVGALGVWLIMHAGDENGLRWERPLGGSVLFLSGLGLLHILASLLAADGRTPRAVADASDGGGWLGYAIANALTLNLGTAPSVASLAVIGALGASMMLGRPLRETASMAADATVRTAAALWGRRPSFRRRRSRRAVLASRATDDAQRWRLPPLDDVLDTSPPVETTQDDAEAIARVIETTLDEFGVPATVIKINRGPSITQFGLEPGYVERAGRRSKVKVSRITSLQNDLALALAASPIRMQAPVPGRPYVGVEVPNSAMSLVSLPTRSPRLRRRAACRSPWGATRAVAALRPTWRRCLISSWPARRAPVRAWRSTPSSVRYS
jgi:S-DNA-T family DNA segregation ATPase FtsK/SpoIIIE